MTRNRILAAVSGIGLVLGVSLVGFNYDRTRAETEPGTQASGVQKAFSFVGTRGYLVGDPKGNDRFDYGGSDIRWVDGGIVANLDPDKGTGTIVASFFYEGDKYVFIQEQMQRIVTNQELHGNTGTGPAVLPKVFTYVATWGPTTVWKNGRILYENIPGHMMLTESVRDEVTHKVDFKGPMKVKEYPGSVANPNDTQVHFVVHTDDKVEGKFPPNSWFAHYMADAVLID